MHIELLKYVGNQSKSQRSADLRPRAWRSLRSNKVQSQAFMVTDIMILTTDFHFRHTERVAACS